MGLNKSTIWQTYFEFELTSGNDRFKTSFNCISKDAIGAWAQVSSTVGGHSPPIESIRLVKSEHLHDATPEKAYEVLKSLRSI